jgi:RimJ/RimL family protein N-acetyltransferase
MLEKIVIRDVVYEDIWPLLDWRLDGVEQAWQITGRNPSQKDHEIWFNQRLSIKESSPFLAGEYENQTFAYCRFDHTTNQNFTVSVLVSPKFRGLGFSSPFLLQATEFVRSRFPECSLHAFVHKNNIPSIKLFINCGFLDQNSKSDSFSHYFLPHIQDL